VFRLGAKNIFHYVAAVDPTIADVPLFTPFIWLNSTTGTLFSCTDNNPASVVWKYSGGEIS